MTDTRRDIILGIVELSEQYPEMRFGQMVLSVAHLARGYNIESIDVVEDDEFLVSLRKRLSQKE